MAGANLVTIMKEETTSKQLTELMKELVQTLTAPEETRKKLREKIEEVCGNKREKEHSRRVEEFTFSVPTKSIEKWTEELRNAGIEPIKDVHYKTEYGVNYVNGIRKSWIVNEDAEAWKAVDAARDDYDRKEDRRLDSLREGEEKTRKEISNDDLITIFDETKRRVRKKNREARLVQPKWVIAERTQNNDAQYEDKELRFRERDEKNRKDDSRDTDWVQNIKNIAKLGEQLGYTEKHYKSVLARFISWFNPELSIVTDPLHATDVAKFLMRLNMPDTEEEKLEKQINKLTRRAGTSLRPVMAYLYEIVTAKYADLPQNEKETEVRKEMIRGLVRFTRGDLQVQLVQAIEFARKKKDKIDWRVLLEKSIEAELTQGMPQIDIKFTSNEADETATHKLYNVCAGISSKPKFEPKTIPGQGEYVRTEYTDDPEADKTSYYNYGENYPTKEELIRELKILNRTKEEPQGEAVSTDRQKQEGKLTGPHRAEIEEICEKLQNLYKDDSSKGPRRDIEKEKSQKGPKEMERRSSTRTTKKPDRLQLNAVETKSQSQNDNKHRSPSIGKTSSASTDRSRSNSRDKEHVRSKHDKDDKYRYNTDRSKNYPYNKRSGRQEGRSYSRDRPNNKRQDRSFSRDYRNGSSDRNGRYRNKDQRRDDSKYRKRRNGRRDDSNIRTNYASPDRSRDRTRGYRTPQERYRTPQRSESRGRRQSDRPENRNNYDVRTNSRDSRDRKYHSNDKPVINTILYCDRCGYTNHNPWDCTKYSKKSNYQCTECKKGLYHWTRDCKERKYVKGDRSNSGERRSTSRNSNDIQKN
jgi:hypothetical protein